MELTPLQKEFLLAGIAEAQKTVHTPKVEQDVDELKERVRAKRRVK